MGEFVADLLAWYRDNKLTVTAFRSDAVVALPKKVSS